jgi:hypothetical protein
MRSKPSLIHICLMIVPAAAAVTPAQAAEKEKAPAKAAPSAKILPFEIGTLDSSGIKAKGPRLFFSQEEIDRAKGRIAADDETKAILERLTAEAKKDLELEIKPLDESWWEKAKGKKWEDTYPEVFENTWLKPGTYAHPAASLATEWLLTGEQKYADKTIALLKNLSSYQFQAEHYDVGMNYSTWGLDMLKAYDAVLPMVPAVQRRAIDGCMTRLATAVARNDAYWIEHNTGGGINNHLAWHKTMLGLLGLFYDRPEMVDYCMNGRRGLVSLLEDGLVDDGLWCESSLNYQFAAIAPMLAMADCQKRMGQNPGLGGMVVGNGRMLKQAFDAMFNVLAADGTIPPIGDAYGRHVKLYDVGTYETCWSLWGDAKYAWLTAHNPEPSANLLMAPPLPAGLTPPPIRSTLLPEHGYAFLRSQTDEMYWDTDAWCAFLTYDRSGVHANADKLSLMLFGQKRMLLSDVEGQATAPHAFSSRIQRELNRGGLSQNTVMIDGADQRYASEMLRLIEFHELPEEKRVTAVDDKGILYEGVRQMRTIAMTPEYVLDVFQVDCGQQARQIDWVAHVLDGQATMPPEGNPGLAAAKPFKLPDTGAWRWLRDAKSLKPVAPIQMEWKDGEVRARLRMLDAGADRVILCGYPTTDKADSPSVPMMMVRKKDKQAVFAAVWLIGSEIENVEFQALPRHDGKLVYQVKAGEVTRKHLVPALGQ